MYVILSYLAIKNVFQHTAPSSLFVHNIVHNKINSVLMCRYYNNSHVCRCKLRKRKLSLCHIFTHVNDLHKRQKKSAISDVVESSNKIVALGCSSSQQRENKKSNNRNCRKKRRNKKNTSKLIASLYKPNMYRNWNNSCFEQQFGGPVWPVLNRFPSAFQQVNFAHDNIALLHGANLHYHNAQQLIHNSSMQVAGLPFNHIQQVVANEPLPVIQNYRYSDALKRHIPQHRNYCSSCSGPVEDGHLKQYLKSIRYEKFTPYGESLKEDQPDLKPEDGVFKVLSYNVLSQYLLESLQDQLYSKHDYRYLDWTFRSTVLINEFKEFNADILCLQEVDISHLDFFVNLFESLGYKGIYKKRTNDKTDGCAIFYRDSIFELKEEVSVEYNQPNYNFLNRDNIGIIARFQCRRGSDKTIIIANTHLLFNPRRHDIKLSQLQMLLAEIERVAFKNYTEEKGTEYHPVILVGDFNLEPFTPVYNFLTKGILDYYQHESNDSRFKLRPLPKCFNITETCQHTGVIKNRQNTRTEISDFKYVKLYNSDRKSLSKVTDLSCEEELSCHSFGGRNSGTLRHQLNLKSAYPHGYRDSDVTTHQSKWCIVDYIFYGPVTKNAENEADGELKLVSLLTLPKVSQMGLIRYIPNAVCGSDHLPILATFHLPPNQCSNNDKQQ